MRGKAAFFSGVLALLGALSANAQNVTIQANQPYYPGMPYVVKGLLENDGTDEIFNISGSVSLAVPGTVATTPLLSSLTMMAPDPLAINDTYNGDMFELNIMPDATGIIEGSFLVNYSDIDGDYSLGPVAFRLNPAAVPEPGTVAMLMGSGLAGAMFVARRRRQ